MTTTTTKGLYVVKERVKNRKVVPELKRHFLNSIEWEKSEVKWTNFSFLPPAESQAANRAGAGAESKQKEKEALPIYLSRSCVCACKVLELERKRRRKNWNIIYVMFLRMAMGNTAIVVRRSMEKSSRLSVCLSVCLPVPDFRPTRASLCLCIPLFALC